MSYHQIRKKRFKNQKTFILNQFGYFRSTEWWFENIMHWIIHNSDFIKRIFRHSMALLLETSHFRQQKIAQKSDFGQGFF